MDRGTDLRIGCRTPLQSKLAGVRRHALNLCWPSDAVVSTALVHRNRGRVRRTPVRTDLGRCAGPAASGSFAGQADRCRSLAARRCVPSPGWQERPIPADRDRLARDIGLGWARPGSGRSSSPRCQHLRQRRLRGRTTRNRALLTSPGPSGRLRRRATWTSVSMPYPVTSWRCRSHPDSPREGVHGVRGPWGATRRQGPVVSGGDKFDSCGGRKSDSRQHGLAAG